MQIISTSVLKKSATIGLLLLVSQSAFALMPQIVAHRAGTADAPENTLYAIEQAKSNKADAIWLTVQLSKDNQLVLYRPSDLNALTDKSGVISDYSAKQLSQINAAYKFNQKNNQQLPTSQTTIVTLEDVLKKYPDTIFYIDLKSPDADPNTQAQAILALLNKTNAFNQVRFYSTNDAFLKALKPLSSKLQLFESRDETRTMLANSVMSHQCMLDNDKSATRWYGFELHRKVEVVEKYTLGEARSPATLSWDKEAIDCFRKNGNAYIIVFGVNSDSDYQLAKEIGADAVMVDSPKAFKK
ncbi:glycerophosphodiester phosphodiesterase [Providencia sp. PROV188]|jgi:glycerophosphoryl diester phosphodiesterase|nr:MULTISPECIES: glycerophosphodiester phosphodiesterase family protein [Providencia]MBG5884491.1 glycerophosphodiester phosphodiesterase [Providencia alcalifaciens]MDR2243704.1 glycerophosphodiester phosphodiesterase [Providencia alcalifaciens]MDR2989792.1 glycerophosphodiester phosphodiesterase [Providencia alcalifaciens]MTB47417.1 glycerophosphodiester phosphodiesterase [Providencia sp. wls1950]MTC24976.1 glycerophosphodiester phosphodiesterase [Providencia sp. wls1938]